MTARVILVHGAFHGAWCWAEVVRGLRVRGVETHAVDLPGHGANDLPLEGLEADARAVRFEIAAGDRPVVLCGHSYGGAVVTEAVDAAHTVDHLVYLAAAVPARGESLSTCMPEVLDARISTATNIAADGVLTVDPAQAVDVFYHDCDPAVARRAVSQLGPQTSASLSDAATREPWRTVGSTYVVCRDDRVMPPVAQERMAKRCGARIGFETGHSPMLSRPELVVSLLAELAQALD